MAQVSMHAARPPEHAMRPIRTLATAAAALVAALLLTAPLVRAEPQPGASAGAPLKLIPPPKRSPSAHRDEETRKPQHIATHRGRPAGRLASRALKRGHVMSGPDNVDLVV